MKKKLLNSMRVLLVAALLGVGANAWAQELTAVSTETTWDFTSMSFSSSALETAQYLQDNTVYLGPGVIKNGRAAFTAAFKAGADGQCLIMVSTYRGYVSVSDGTSVVVDYNATGNTYHDGGMAYYRHVFSVAAGKTYYIYTTNIASLNNGKSDVGVIKMDYRPIGVNTTTAFSSTEVVNINVNANFPQIAYQGITYDNVYVGQGVVYTNSRHTFGGATSGDTKNPTTYAFSFKLPAGKGSLYIDPSSWHNTSNYVKLSNGEEILLHMGKAAHHSESGDAAIAARTYAYESSTETTMYVYSTASGDGYGLYGITWTPTTHTYTINAVDGSGNLLQQLTSATCIEGGSYSFVGVPKVVSKDGKYYVLNDANVSGYTTPDYIMGAEDEVKTITYTEDASIVYFAEVENLSNATGKTDGNYSGGKYAAIDGSKYGTLTTLNAGNYQVEGDIKGNDNRGMYIRSSAANTAESVLGYKARVSGVQTIDITLIGSTTLYLSGYTGDKSVNRSADIDYIIIRLKNVPATVGANGYATFASPYALDLTDTNRPAGLKAYKATLAGTTLTFTALNQTVPAGTGLLLLGDTNGGTYNIPVVASGDAVTNDLVGVTTDTPLQSTEGGIYYFVMKKATTAEDALAFAPLSTSSAVTIPAGKAYVALDTSAGARSLTVAFDDETTGINLVNGEGIKGNGFYNLNGQRVENPTKGLYIMNGKKVILK